MQDIARNGGSPALSDEAVLACVLSAKHLLNALCAIGIDPATIATQEEALEMVWPTKWGYDAWCAWHACRIIARRAGWDLDELSRDRRTGWRTSAQYIDGKAIVGPDR